VGQDGSDQIHDYEPGIMPNGLFWTVPITPDAIESNLGTGTARFHMTNMAIPDFHDFANSIGSTKQPIPTTPASATFDVRWQASKQVIPLRDAASGYAGEFMDSQATMSWSVEQPAQHFQFATDDAGTNTVGGVIGRERNGVYFRLAAPLLG
jgi:hypothetical protein